MNTPVIILGAGGHARVLLDTLRLLSIEVLGATIEDAENVHDKLPDIPILGQDTTVFSYSPDSVKLVIGFGTIRVNPRRADLFDYFKSKGYSFASVIHPSVILARDVALSEGLQIMAGAVIQAGCELGENCLINTCAVLDHDCRIGAHTHIASGAVLSGAVVVGARSHVGAGATIIQGVRIGSNSVVGAGAVVIRDVGDNETVIGVPAREVKR